MLIFTSLSALEGLGGYVHNYMKSVRLEREEKRWRQYKKWKVSFCTTAVARIGGVPFVKASHGVRVELLQGG